MRQAIAQVEAGGKRDDNESNENNESIDNKNVTTASETMAEGDRRFIMQATRFVLEHLDEPDFNINLLCHEMAMSRTLFYSRLKSLTGKGPQEFIRIIRLQKAAELLKEGKSVTDVAAETGLSTRSISVHCSRNNSGCSQVNIVGSRQAFMFGFELKLARFRYGF